MYTLHADHVCNLYVIIVCLCIAFLEESIIFTEQTAAFIIGICGCW